MDAIQVIVTALAAGVVSGLSDTASSAIAAAYDALVLRVKHRLRDRRDADLILASHAKDPQSWQAALTTELVEAGAESDRPLLDAAQQLLALVDEAGAKAGRYAIDLHGAQGIQIGDHSKMHNIFNVHPSS